MTDVLALLLAGGRVDELLCLTEKRAKAALPIFGIYRVIDFVLSNCMHAGIAHVGVLSQYRPQAIVRHIDTGEHWDYIGRQRSIRILPPYSRTLVSDWYKGTADAVYQNIPYIEEYKPEHVLIAAADHVYRMNYKPLITYHIEHDADATIGLTITAKKHRRFGYGVMDSRGRLQSYMEKPAAPPSNLASMTLYVFKTQFLVDVLKANSSEDSHEFGRDIIPQIIGNNRIFGYVFKGYWAYARSVQDYYNTNMDLLYRKISLDDWQIRTNLLERCTYKDRLPAHVDGTVINSVVGDECYVAGKVTGSILGPGVTVEHGAEIIDSILFHDTTVRSRARLRSVICDKDTVIGKSAVIGGYGKNIPSHEFSTLLHSGITLIGKGVSVPERTRIGSNVVIYPTGRIEEPDIQPGSVLR